jgi:hypothetical protein
MAAPANLTTVESGVPVTQLSKSSSLKVTAVMAAPLASAAIGVVGALWLVDNYTDYCRRDLAFLVEGVNCRSPQVLEAAQFCVKLCKLKFALAGAYAGLVGGLRISKQVAQY